MADNVKAKEMSKWGQVFSFVFFVVGAIAMFFTNPETLTVINLLTVSIAAPLCFTQTWVSIIIDKIKGAPSGIPVQ